MPGKPLNEPFQHPPRSWWKKFADAARGLRQGTRGQSSFLVHLPAASAVLGLAAFLALPLVHGCLLLLCIGTVLAAELFNSSLERLARSITEQVNPDIEAALNIASAAVLVMAITAALVGGTIFLNAFWA